MYRGSGTEQENGIGRNHETKKVGRYEIAHDAFTHRKSLARNNRRVT